MTGDDINKTVADRLYHDPQLAEFYDLENQWGPDSDYCLALAAPAHAVLDLGCGTGRLTAAMVTDECAVFGVDPAAAMLDIARARPGGELVTWIKADARELRLGLRFDLVVLTGHAFQVFLNDSDQSAVLETIAAHLTPQGRFVFDSRNPAAEEWRTWTPEASRRLLKHPRYGEIKAWNTARDDPHTDNITYETHYIALSTGQKFSAQSDIRFTPHEKLAAMIEKAGLEVDRWLGDWSGSDLAANSPELIPLGRLRA